MSQNLKRIIDETIGEEPIEDDFGLELEHDVKGLLREQLKLYDEVIMAAPPSLRKKIVELYSSLLAMKASSVLRIWYGDADVTGKYARIVEEYDRCMDVDKE